MSTIQEIQKEIIDEFTMLDEWRDRYDYIIDLGRDLPLIETKYKIEENLIKGCQSNVWLHADMNGDKIVFTADSDGLISKGVISLIIRVFSNQKPKDILEADTDFIKTIGLKEHLTMNRGNGLISMLKQIKIYALIYHSKSEV